MLAGERERAESEPKNLTKKDSEQNKHEINTERERDGRQKTAESLPEVDRREPAAAAAAAAGREERVREGAQRGEDRRFEIRA